VAVEADSGAIGGSASQEFMVTAEAGEDLILSSSDGLYAANQERAVSLAAEAIPLAAQACQELATPGQASIEALAAAHGFDPSQIVKVLLLLGRCADGSLQPVLVSLRGDQLLNEVKLANAVSARLVADQGALLAIEPLTPELVRTERLPLDLGGIPFGSLGPDLPAEALAVVKNEAPAANPSAFGAQAPAQPAPRLIPSWIRLTDPTAAELERFVCGANSPDRHRVGASWSGLGLQLEVVDLRAAQPGDRCRHDPSQTLAADRGIEVGHIFQLGRKYSEALGARFTNEAGTEESLWMGCYGIGVSRLAQAAVEQNHDGNGICWPVAIAPFELIVVIANLQEDAQRQLAESLYSSLQAAGIDVLLDDRDERAGVKFKDADLLGIPWRVVVGRGAKDGQVELVQRQGSLKRELATADLLAELPGLIEAERSGLLA
jgi:prolyl-tRNA synthetase